MLWCAALVAYGLRTPQTNVAAIWTVTAILALLCLLALGLMRRRPGPWLGTAVQVLLVASGFVVTMMFVIGAVFFTLWVVALRLGGRIDDERRARVAAAKPAPAG